jgi:hypothetical protein
MTKNSPKKVVSPRVSKRRAVLAAQKRQRRGADVGPQAVARELQKLFDVLGVRKGRMAAGSTRATGNLVTRSRKLHHAFLIGDLLTQWSQNPEYLDTRGNPIALRLKGKNTSFTSLTLQCAPNANARKVLLDLKRLGAVRIDRAGLIHQLDRSISAYEDKKLAAQHTLSMLHGFIKTLRHNLTSNSSSNSEQLFHRIAWNREFDPSELPRLKIWLKNHGQHFLESADNWMTRSAHTRGRRLSPRKIKPQVSIGLYLAVHDSPNRVSY